MKLSRHKCKKKNRILTSWLPWPIHRNLYSSVVCSDLGGICQDSYCQSKALPYKGKKNNKEWVITAWKQTHACSVKNQRRLKLFPVVTTIVKIKNITDHRSFLPLQFYSMSRICPCVDNLNVSYLIMGHHTMTEQKWFTAEDKPNSLLYWKWCKSKASQII